MNGQRDNDLLRAYAEEGSEAAFGQLVRRYVDMLYSAALRMVNNRQLAEEVTQSVFVALSRNARGLTGREILAGWLHRTTRNLAAKVVRSEVRRRAREQEAAVMNELLSPEAERVWEKLAPNLDAALDQLKEADRSAVLMRFFHQRSAREIGQALGLSEEAAKKRIGRSLERLRRVLVGRGVVVPAGLLTAILAHNAVQAAPAGLAKAALAGVSAAGGAAAAPGGLASVLKALTMTKVQAATVGVLFLAGLATPLALSSRVGAQAQSGAEGPRLPSSRRGPGQLAGSPGATAAATLEGDGPLARLAAWVRKSEQGPPPGDDSELDYLIWSLPAGDYPKAWRLREGLRSGEMRNRFQDRLLTYWTDVDPLGALDAAVSVSKGWGRFESARAVVLESWSKSDPLAALAWVERSVPEQWKASVLSSVIPEVARVDPRAATAALADLPVGWLQRRALAGVVQQWATQAPAAAADYVVNLPRSAQRGELMKDVAQAWAQTDFDGALKWEQGLEPGPERDAVLVGALSVLAGNAPQRAAGLLDKLEGRGLKEELPVLAGTTLVAWAKTDPASAGQWAQDLWARLNSTAGADERRAVPSWLALATRGLLERWADQDPAAAARFALGWPGDNSAQVQHALARWVGQDSQAALDWANNLSSGPGRDAALAGVCEGLAGSDPARAAALVTTLPSGQPEAQAAAEVASTWAGTDPQAAAQWVGALPEGETRARAAGRLMETWATRGQAAEAAAEWLAQLPEGPTRDQAARSFVSGAFWNHPELAAQWVGAFAGEDQRNAQIEQIARRWLNTDPEAARQWLQSTALPDGRKQQLLAQ